MISDEAAAVVTCAALSTWLYLKPNTPLLSPGWATLFGFIFYRRELWSTLDGLAARVPWPTKIFLITILFYSLFQRGRPNVRIQAREGVEEPHDSDRESQEKILKPLLFPARTTHTRLFPQKHSFSYSYLLVGIPVGWRDTVGSLLSVDIPSTVPKQSIFQRPWFSVHAGDYLARGDEHLGLRGKLRSYLKSQGEDIHEYPYAYLVTAPRFLRYSFNPVSFWYLYNKHKELQAMILEVNNTFDERRMYFLKDSTLDDPDESWTLIDKPPSKFKNTWPKDFHVSPFNSRKGSYALTAQDPFSPHLSATGKVDNTITLISSKAHVKLIARIFSTQPAIDPSTLGCWARLAFIASWWWVGFVTFPRIVREAGKLFFRRKLHVWYRPEVLKDSIGRPATKDEIIIERTFQPFLRSLIESSNPGHSVKYTCPISSAPTEETFTPESPSSIEPLQNETIEFKVTTPLFYARLARHPHISEFLSNEILKDDDKDRTFYTSHPHLLLQLLEEPQRTETSVSWPSSLTEKSSTVSSISWRFLHWLRNHVRPSSGQHPQQRNQLDIRHFDFSTLDRYSMRHDPPDQAARYRGVVTKLLLSDLIAMGHPEILDAVCYMLRVGGSYLLVVAVRGFWRWVLREQSREVRMCYQAEDEAWCEIETW